MNHRDQTQTSEFNQFEPVRNLGRFPWRRQIESLLISAITYDAVQVGVEAPDVMGGVAAGGHGGASQRLQAFLVPHVGSPGPTAVRGRQVEGGAALRRSEVIVC